MSRIESTFNEFVATDGLVLPLPGEGATWQRFLAFAHVAAKDLSTARLCEGHGDALAILSEAGMKPVEGASYGVWASLAEGGGTVAERVPGGWRLSGTKRCCWGYGIVDRALVTAATDEGYLIFDLPTDEHVVAIEPDGNPSVVVADWRIDTLRFVGPLVADESRVGMAGFYTHRPGYWFGAAGVAACWYGAALGLVNSVAEERGTGASDRVLAEWTDAVAGLELMRDVLCHVAHAFDEDPLDAGGQAHSLAVVARHVVRDSCQTILAGVIATGGVSPLRPGRLESRRAADLYAYLLQHGGHCGAGEIGRALVGPRS